MIFRQICRKCTTAEKPVFKPMELILNKNGMCLSPVSSRFRKINLKTFGPHCF
jgi:hypothetical protein